MKERMYKDKRITRVFAFILALAMIFTPMAVPSVSAASGTTIYKQVETIDSGKDYILAVSDGTSYYAIQNRTKTLPALTVGAFAVTVEEGDDYGFAGTNIIESAETSIVWTAATTTSGFTLKNGGYYLFGGKLNVNTGMTDSSQSTGHLWSAVSERACILTGTAIYGLGGGNDFYFTYSSGTGFDVIQNARNNPVPTGAAHIYIFEKTAISTGNIEITGYEAIPDLDAGKAGSATYVDAAAVIEALPTAVTIAGMTDTVPVSWADTGNYDANTAGTYVFTGTPGSLPTGYVDKDEPILTVKANVVVAPAASGTMIYKQVETIDSGKDYILAAFDGTSYYAIQNRIKTLPALTVGAFAVTVEEGDDYGFSGTNIIKTAETSIVWTAATTTSGFTLKNDGFYLFGGKLNVNTGLTDSSQSTGHLWSAVSERACILTGTAIYGLGGGNDFYFSYSSGTGFDVIQNARNNPIPAGAAHIYIFEKAIADSAEPESQAFFGSDIHENTAALTGILEAVKADSIPEAIVLAGDYHNGINGTAVNSTVLNAAIDAAGIPSSTRRMFFTGNHDSSSLIGTGDFEETGEAYKDDAMIIYGINERDFPANSSAYSTAKETADELDSYLDRLSDTDKNKAIFIVCHVPLHVQKGDNPGGYYMANMLKEATNSDNLDIVFVWGHNHLTEPVNTNILVTSGGIYSFNNNGTATTISGIGFTYINAGYINATGLGLLASVDEDVITLQRYTNAGKSGNATVIERKEIDRIAITKAPDKISYNAGQRFDPTGMVVTAYYSDGGSAPINDYTYSPAGPLSAADTQVVISYKGKSATQEITVTEASSYDYSQAFFGSDMHTNTARLTSILNAVTAHAIPDVIAMTGDFNSNWQITVTSPAINAAIDAAGIPSSTRRLFFTGNHDSTLVGSGDFKPTGEAYRDDDMIIYGINEEDFPSTYSDSIGAYSKAITTTDNLAAYLNSLSDTDKDKAIFIVCHIPLHAQREDNPGGYYMANMLKDGKRQIEYTLKSILESERMLLTKYDNRADERSIAYESERKGRTATAVDRQGMRSGGKRSDARGMVQES